MNQVKRITLIVKLVSSLCDYSVVYLLVKGTTRTVRDTARAGQAAINANKKSAPFTSCISRINNTQKDDAQYNDVVIPMRNLIEYSDNY